MKKISIFLLLLILILGTGVFLIIHDKNYAKEEKKGPPLTKRLYPEPEISAWIAWWAEKSAYETLQKNPNKIRTVSPVWFMVDENLKLASAGSASKAADMTLLKAAGVKVMPSLGSSISSDKLHTFLNNTQKSDILISQLASAGTTLGADGIDVDLEGIKKEDKEKFTAFLTKLKKELGKYSMEMSVAVHAQTGVMTWDGPLGQDLSKIGQIADEVRIMTYDEHAPGTDQGPISSYNYLRNAAIFTKLKISHEKIVIGIPSYGYIWTKDDTVGKQHNEFTDFLAGKTYTTKRDNKSGELIYKNDNFTGWLSDAKAIENKINFLRSLGFNKFVIWHLGGIDDNFFGINWSKKI